MSATSAATRSSKRRSSSSATRRSTAARSCSLIRAPRPAQRRAGRRLTAASTVDCVGLGHLEDLLAGHRATLANVCADRRRTRPPTKLRSSRGSSGCAPGHQPRIPVRSSRAPPAQRAPARRPAAPPRRPRAPSTRCWRRTRLLHLRRTAWWRTTPARTGKRTGRAARVPARARPSCRAWNTGEATLSRISTKFVQRHLGDRLGVVPAARLEQRQRRGPVVAGLVEAAVQLDHVLEGAVGALAVERHDRVRGVAEQRRPARPRCHGRAADRAEQADRVVPVVVDQVGRERRRRPGSTARSAARSPPGCSATRSSPCRRWARTACR